MNQIKELNEEFSEWFNKNWAMQGGLIQPNVAASILKVSIARISQMVSELKLNQYISPGGKVFLSFAEVLKFKSERC